MLITVISGSTRRSSESLRISGLIAERISKLNNEFKARVISLEDNPFPFWDEDSTYRTGGSKKAWEDIEACLCKSDGFIVVVPEWNGMIPPGLKNFFHLIKSREVGHKPAVIVAISAGDGGAYAVAEIKMFSAKNNHLVYIPEQIVIRRVNYICSWDQNDLSKHQMKILSRIDYSLSILFLYCSALREVRSGGAIDYAKFGTGM